MTRARRRSLLLAAVALLGLLVTSSAALAAPKQKIAVLGLEVVTTSVDPQDSEVAGAFTNELRARAKLAASPYTLAPGAERELIDEKLTGDCDNEAADCMAKIGSGLRADQLMWGKVEKSGGDYKITIKILNTNRKSADTWGPKTISAKAAKTSALADLAHNAYDTLTGMNTGGTLVLKSNVPTGTVYIGDEEKGQIKDGTFVLTLPENRYTVAIESTGFRRWESETVTIRGGQTETVEAELINLELGHERGGTGSQHNSRVGLKVLAGTSLAVAAGSAAYWIYTWNDGARKYNDFTNKYGSTDEMPRDVNLPSKDNCDTDGLNKVSGSDLTAQQIMDAQGYYDNACSTRTSQAIAIGVTIAAGAVGIGTLIYMAVTDPDSSESSTQTTGIRKKKKPAIAITPIVSPTTGGATFRIDF